MEDIYSVIGFNIISFAVTLVIVSVFGFDMDNKDKAKMIIGEVIFVALVSVRAMLMNKI